MEQRDNNVSGGSEINSLPHLLIVYVCECFNSDAKSSTWLWRPFIALNAITFAIVKESNLHRQSQFFLWSIAAYDIYADNLPISILNQITWPYNDYHLEPSIISNRLSNVFWQFLDQLWAKKLLGCLSSRRKKHTKIQSSWVPRSLIVTPRISQSRHIISMEFTPDHHHNWMLLINPFKRKK